MSASPVPTPVTVVTGFLGAGKTTLVNRWLGERPRGETAVIVNEHGDVGIDGELLAERARTLVEITGGCVCCSTQAELVRALDELAGAGRILIETSGAASPSGVLHAILGAEARGTHVLDAIVTVVDATRAGELREHDLAVEQVGYADIVVLSHLDHARPDAATVAVSSINGAAVVRGPGPLDVLLAERAGDFGRDVAPAAPHVYESIALVADGDVDGERFADFMETEVARFAGRIFRTKGILAVAGLDERMMVQGVTDRVDLTFGRRWEDGARRSRLVIVGYGLDRDALERAFQATLASGGPEHP